jgi:hypothetical protein
MHDQPILTEPEWALVIELLQLEQRELPVEIRHATGLVAREEMHRRLQMVQALLNRLQSTVAAAV